MCKLMNKRSSEEISELALKIQELLNQSKTVPAIASELNLSQDKIRSVINLRKLKSLVKRGRPKVYTEEERIASSKRTINTWRTVTMQNFGSIPLYPVSFDDKDAIKQELANLAETLNTSKIPYTMYFLTLRNFVNSNEEIKSKFDLYFKDVLLDKSIPVFSTENNENKELITAEDVKTVFANTDEPAISIEFGTNTEENKIEESNSTNSNNIENNIEENNIVNSNSIENNESV